MYPSISWVIKCGNIPLATFVSNASRNFFNDVPGFVLLDEEEREHEVGDGEPEAGPGHAQPVDGPARERAAAPNASTSSREISDVD